jgi:hypothetical protein
MLIFLLRSEDKLHFNPVISVVPLSIPFTTSPYQKCLGEAIATIPYTTFTPFYPSA